jgi:hypothetical protein
MLQSTNSGPLVSGPLFPGAAQMLKALVIRGVYIRGQGYAEGAVVELSPQEFAELRSWNYVVAAPPVAPAPASVEAPASKRKPAA